MNFSDIARMLNLINHISSSAYRSRLEYRVWVYADDKDRSLTKKPIKKLRFGNLNQSEFSTDRVNITVYKDQADLHCIAEGAKHHIAQFDQKSKEIELENKIMMAFDRWSSYYLD